MWWLAALLLGLVVATVVIHFVVLAPRLAERHGIDVETGDFPGYEELQRKLAEAIGPPDRARTEAMIKEFLDWFNANRERLGGVSDEQLETLIKAYVARWSYRRQYAFKKLIDGYRANEERRKRGLPAL